MISLTQHSSRILAAALLATAAAATATAQFVYSESGSIYNQNFNSLAWANNTVQTWANNTTLSGWYVHLAGNTNPANYYGRQVGGSGTDNGTFGLYNNADDAGNYSLGARTVAAMGNASIGFRIQNDTGGTLSSFNLSYQAAQFYQSGTQYLRVEYSLNATSVTDAGATWHALSALNFNAPLTGANSTINTTQQLGTRTNLSVSNTAVSWSDGSDLWVRFVSYRDFSPDYTGSSAVLTIDNVSFTAIPEPSAFAALAGLGALGLVATRRRRR